MLQYISDDIGSPWGQNSVLAANLFYAIFGLDTAYYDYFFIRYRGLWGSFNPLYRAFIVRSPVLATACAASLLLGSVCGGKCVWGGFPGGPPHVQLATLLAAGIC